MLSASKLVSVEKTEGVQREERGDVWSKENLKVNLLLWFVGLILGLLGL